MHKSIIVILLVIGLLDLTRGHKIIETIGPEDKLVIYTPEITEIEFQISSNNNVSVFISLTLDYMNGDINTGGCINVNYCFIKYNIGNDSRHVIITIINNNEYSTDVDYIIYYKLAGWEGSIQFALLFLLCSIILFFCCMIFIVKYQLSLLRKNYVDEINIV